MAVVALMSCAALSAQERMSEEQRAQAIAERIEAAGTRMAKEFKLKDDAQKTFVETFTAYQKEQQIATMQKRLEVQKKYAEEFGKVLTPQQVLKVLTPQRGQGSRGQGQRGQGNGERRGGFGEGGPRGGFGGGPRGGFGGGF